MKSTPKDRLIETASRLFFQEGFTVGIDRIIAESQIAKMTFYRHFASKELLICGVLEEAQSRLEGEIEDLSTRMGSSSPREKLSVVSQAISDSLRDPLLQAGLAHQAIVDFPDPSHPAHQRACQFKKSVMATLQQFCEEAELAEPATATVELMIALEGGFTMSPVLGQTESRHAAEGLSELIIARWKKDGVGAAERGGGPLVGSPASRLPQNIPFNPRLIHRTYELPLRARRLQLADPQHWLLLDVQRRSGPMDFFEEWTGYVISSDPEIVVGIVEGRVVYLPDIRQCGYEAFHVLDGESGETYELYEEVFGPDSGFEQLLKTTTDNLLFVQRLELVPYPAVPALEFHVLTALCKHFQRRHHCGHVAVTPWEARDIHVAEREKRAIHDNLDPRYLPYGLRRPRGSLEHWFARLPLLEPPSE